jgi:hypothetical protein
MKEFEEFKELQEFKNRSQEPGGVGSTNALGIQFVSFGNH